MAEVLVIGSSAISNSVYVDNLPNVNGSVYGSMMYKFPSGNGVNEAVSFAKLNKNVELITKVGKDDNGKIILNALSKEKVCINNILFSNKFTNIEQTTISLDGNYYKTVLNYIEKEFTDEELKKIAESIKKCKYLILNADINKESIIEIIFKAYFTGKKIILNPIDTNLEYDKKLLSMIDYITPNVEQLSKITKTDIKTDSQILEGAKKLITLGVKNVIVKNGENGVIVVNKQEVFKVSGKNVKTLDKQGAGDNFISAFVSALIDGKDLKDAVYYANISSSITIQRKGTIPSFPIVEFIEKELKK